MAFAENHNGHSGSARKALRWLGLIALCGWAAAAFGAPVHADLHEYRASVYLYPNIDTQSTSTTRVDASYGVFAPAEEGGAAPFDRAYFAIPARTYHVDASADDRMTGWTWSEQRLSSPLPEMPELPVIEWTGPFESHPTTVALNTVADESFFKLSYQYPTIRRGDTYIDIFPLRLWMSPDIQVTRRSFDVTASVPVGYVARSVTISNRPIQWGYGGGWAWITLDSMADPVGDLILTYVPKPSGLCVIGTSPVPVVPLVEGPSWKPEQSLKQFMVWFSDAISTESRTNTVVKMTGTKPGGGEAPVANVVPAWMNDGRAVVVYATIDAANGAADYTLQIGDAEHPLADGEGNLLDGECPDGLFPSGDGTPDGIFKATYTVVGKSAASGWAGYQ